MTSEKDVDENELGHDNHAFTKNEGHLQVSFKDRPHIGSAQDKKLSLTSSGIDVEEDEDVDVSCGVGNLRTNIFGRKFANLYVFSICMGLSSFFTMMVQSVFHVQLTSIERQFKIDNSKAALFDTSARIGSLCTVLFAGHFVKKVNIPLVVGFAGILQGIVLMVPAFFQFFDPYVLPLLAQSGTSSNNSNASHLGDNGQYMCRESKYFGNGSLVANSSTPEQTNHLAFVVIVAVQALKGITDSFHAGFLPALYIDDNMVDKTKMGIFFGINSVISELATPIGKQINGILSDVPIDLKPTEMNPKDSRFVAAWWLAFLVFGAGTFIFSIPVMLFPKRLVSKRQQEKALEKAMISFSTGDMVGDAPDTEDTKATPERKDTIEKTGINPERSGSQFGKNHLAPRISQLSVNSDVRGHIARKRSSLLPPIDGPSERRISIDGTMVFEVPAKPKKRNDQGEPIQGSSKLKDLIRDFPRAFIRLFSRPVFVIIIIDIIVVSVPMIGIAIFRSVYISNEYNVPMSEVARLTGITGAVAQILGIVISGFLANKVRTKTGYNYILVGTYLLSIIVTPLYIVFGCDNQVVYGHEGDFGVPLNMTDICDCRGTKQLISCGTDNNNYLSPCHAGCLDVDGKKFIQCSGLGQLNVTQDVTLIPGLCKTDCHRNFIIYVALQAIQALLSAMGTIPRRLLILRMVDPRDRGFATSVFAFSSMLVSVASPNVFGSIIDGTCLIWDGDYCSLYDRDKIRYLLSGLDVAVNIMIQFTMFIIIFLFKKEERDLKKKLLEEQQEKNEDTEMGVKS